MAAASALMLTACTSEDDVLQSSAPQKAEAKALGFDVYLPQATNVTRAGETGIMNTTRLQTIGFGILGYYSDDNIYPTSGYVPNFMYNQQVTWDNTSKGWAYTPLKYWPNETIKDSQTNPAVSTASDKLTFFAYAPYVSTISDAEGITAITANDDGKLTPYTTGDSAPLAAGDPAVEYIAPALIPNGVDLLWGVAPAGGLHYTAVDGNVSGADEGMPYVNLVKPDVNTSLKFYFQHALARFGFTVAAAIDQVPQGGSLASDDKTRVTVESVELEGYIAKKGILNLNNIAPNVANWTSLNGTALDKDDDLGDGALVKRTITISGDNLNPDIKDNGSDVTAQSVEGVTGSKKDLILARYYNVDKPTTVKAGDRYYIYDTDHYAVKYAGLTSGTYYYKDGNDYKKVQTSEQFPTTYYTITEGSELAADPASPGTYVIYEKVGNDYIYETTFVQGTSPATELAYGTKHYYSFTPATTDAVTASSFTWTDETYYKAERSYFMVVPTNNIPNICKTNFGAGKDANIKALRTVKITITYYVTTEDDKLANDRSRVKNVISQTVELPSLDNGKSYNFNILLGLTSVKVDAEVGDWSEEFIQADLPQNTPGE